jgi:hypothetical protein
MRWCCCLVPADYQHLACHAEGNESRYCGEWSFGGAWCS